MEDVGAGYNPYLWRIPVGDDYVAALGRAVYNFTYLEWGIVWLAETLDRGFINRVNSFTAGMIAASFERLVAKSDASAPDFKRMTELANLFKDLVQERNALLHGNPYTAEGGEQCLLYTGKAGRRAWSIIDILETAKSFQEAAIEANDILHGGRLATYQKAASI